MKYTITTNVYGNPDHREDPNVPPIGVENETLCSDTVNGLKDEVRKWQDANLIGGGNWEDPVVKNGEKIVGYMSYNGRVRESK